MLLLMVVNMVLRDIRWRHLLLCQGSHHRTSTVVGVISNTIERSGGRWRAIAARKHRRYAATPCGMSVGASSICAVRGDGGDAGVGVVDTEEDVTVAGAAPDATRFVVFVLGVVWDVARARYNNTGR